MTKRLILTLTAAVGLTAIADLPPARAADIAPMPVKAAPPAIWNPWMIRVRALVVDPKNDVTFDQLPGGGKIRGLYSFRRRPGDRDQGAQQREESGLQGERTRRSQVCDQLALQHGIGHR